MSMLALPIKTKHKAWEREALKTVSLPAGVIGVPGKGGEDQQLRVNHMGPFLLTRLLWGGLAPGARVVNVASRAHKQGSLRIMGGRIVGTPWHWCGPQGALPLELLSQAVGFFATKWSSPTISTSCTPFLDLNLCCKGPA
jgi:hypothetical protein